MALKTSSFTKPFDLVITEEIAIKYFGRTNVVGEMMTICCARGEPVTLPVTGVLQDLPRATHLNTNMIVYMQPSLFNEPGTLETWTSVNVYTYFKMRPGVTLEQFQQRLTYWVDNESPFLEMFKENMGRHGRRREGFGVCTTQVDVPTGLTSEGQTRCREHGRSHPYG